MFCNHDKQMEQAYEDLLNSSKQTLASMMELQEALLENNQAVKDANGIHPVFIVLTNCVGTGAKGQMGGLELQLLDG